MNLFFARRRRDKELEQEIRSHFEQAVRDRMERGETAEEAERSARAEFGNTLLVEEVTRGMWGWNWAAELQSDFRYSVRTMLRNPSFTVVAILTLALGIGATTAVFSVVNGVLLRPLPYVDPDRLVWIHDGMTKFDRTGWSACVADFLVWRKRSHSFESLAAFGSNRFTVTGEGEAVEVPGAVVTADFFRVLGVRPLLGRTFSAGDDEPTRTSTVLISESLWRSRYRGNPNVLGRTIVLNGRSTTIIGVLPSDFHFRLREADLWAIFPLVPPTRRGPFFLRGVARLKPGVTLEQASADMDALGREVEREDPKGLEHARYPIVPLREEVVADIRPLLLVLAGTVMLVLLIAVFNVANLLLARSATRQREVAIRLSIGAGRGRLIRQFLTESVALALAGGAFGVLFAIAGVKVLRSFAPPGLPRLEEIGIDERVLFFTLLASVGSGIAFGLAPAFSSARYSLSGSLKEGGGGTTEVRGYRTLRTTLVTAEIALSVVLLTGAGLLIRSFDLLGRVQPGFQVAPERLLAMQLAVMGKKYADSAQLLLYWQQVAERVRRLPGVESAGITVTLPPDRVAFTDGYEIPGRTPPNGGLPIPVPLVSQDYFRTLGIPLLRGRLFDNRDTSISPAVTVISEAMARRYFAGENPVGQRLKHGGPSLNNPYMEIIGVVGDVKYDGLWRENEPVYYEVISQSSMRAMWLVVRTRGPAPSLLSAVRKEIRAIDPNVAVSKAGAMSELMHDSIALPRFRSTIMGIFAATALLLAAIGIYGVIAYSVSQRTREIGIRMALGATAASVLRLVVEQGGRLALVGIVAGLAGALATVRVLKAMLFGITPTDGVTFASVAVVLTLVALFASYVPARRAARIDPVRALRQE